MPAFGIANYRERNASRCIAPESKIFLPRADGTSDSSALATASASMGLYIIVCGWFVVIYMGLGALLVSNTSVNVALGICALAFACSIFIILELDTPFSGVVGVSNRSVLLAQAELTG